MKKIFGLLALALLGFHFCQAQAAKSVYFELGGPGLASFNFDTRFTPQEGGIGGRLGLGGFSVSGESALFVPLEINYLLGKDNRNYFELGAGVTFVSLSDAGDDDTFESTFGHLYFGYRLQPQHGGFLFKAGIVPVFGHGYFIPYYAGIAFGYKFGH